MISGGPMEKIYRIASVLIMAAAMFLLSFLLLPLYVAAARLGISPWFVQLSIFGGLLLYAWWFMIWNDAQSEPQKDSRLQSVLVWFGTIAIIYAVFRFFARSSGFFLYFCGVNTDYLIVPLLLVLAAGCIIFRPFKRHKQGLLFGIIGTICGLLLWESGKQLGDVSYSYQGKHLPLGYTLPEQMQKEFFPPNASDFEIEGKSGFMFMHAKWSCRVSEKDFEAFRQKTGYRFVLNRCDVNEDPSVGPFFYSDRDWKKPYYFHSNIHPNGGGLVLQYSVPEQKLYGHYSNR